MSCISICFFMLSYYKLICNLQVLMFKNFFCYLSQTDRAFQSYKNFGSNPSTGYAYSSAFVFPFLTPLMCSKYDQSWHTTTPLCKQCCCCCKSITIHWHCFALSRIWHLRSIASVRFGVSASTFVQPRMTER